LKTYNKNTFIKIIYDCDHTSFKMTNIKINIIFDW